jgi:hypothetical protein
VQTLTIWQLRNADGSDAATSSEQEASRERSGVGGGVGVEVVGIGDEPLRIRGDASVVVCGVRGLGREGFLRIRVSLFQDDEGWQGKGCSRP